MTINIPVIDPDSVANVADLWPYTVTDPVSGVVTRLTPATCGVRGDGTPYVSAAGAASASETAYPGVSQTSGLPTITKTGGR